MKSQLPGHPDLLISNDQPADKACHKQWEALEIFFGFCVCVCFVCVCFKCWNWYYEIIVLERMCAGCSFLMSWRGSLKANWKDPFESLAWDEEGQNKDSKSRKKGIHGEIIHLVNVYWNLLYFRDLQWKKLESLLQTALTSGQSDV